jgi:hypothetical protein
MKQMSAQEILQPRPSLKEIREWPAAVPVSLASQAYGISKSHAYEQIAAGEFPAKVIKCGSRLIVVTASIIRSLGGEPDAA